MFFCVPGLCLNLVPLFVRQSRPIERMSIDFRFSRDPCGNDHFSLNHTRANTQGQIHATKRPLLPPDAPTTHSVGVGIDIRTEQLHVPVMDRELLPCD